MCRRGPGAMFELFVLMPTKTPEAPGQGNRGRRRHDRIDHEADVRLRLKTGTVVVSGALLFASCSGGSGAADAGGGTGGASGTGGTTGRVYTTMLPNVSRTTVVPIINTKVTLDSVVYTDGYFAYDNLDVSGFRHRRINHQQHYADRQGNHINGIENFWNQAKRHLRKYNGIPKHHFHLFLKECEWRFNYGSPAKLFSTLKTWIKLANL